MEDNQQVSTHVKYKEIRCRCGACDGGMVSQYILASFEEIRRGCGGQPITITSGYRCPSWNKIVGGVKTSYHMKGMALDMIYPPHIEKQEFFQICARYSKGTGMYSWGVHIDLGQTKKIWIDKSWKEHATAKGNGIRTGQTGKCSGNGEDTKKGSAETAGLVEKKTRMEVKR